MTRLPATPAKLVLNAALALAAACIATRAIAQQPAQQPPPTPAPQTQVKLFALANSAAEETARVLQQILADKRQVRIATDARTNSIVAAGTEEDLLVLEAVITRLDAQESHAPERRTGSGTVLEDGGSRQIVPAGAEIRVRLLWLVAEAVKLPPQPPVLPEPEQPTIGGARQFPALPPRTVTGLPEPPEDLAEVVQELAKLGIKSPKLAAQAVVNGTAGGGQFQMSGSLAAPLLANLAVGGKVEELATGSLRSTLQIDVHEQGTRSNRSLCNLQTTIATPPGHFVVLGVTPTDAMTSIFVLQITPAGEKPAQQQNPRTVPSPTRSSR